jgi:hypothetical protein
MPFRFRSESGNAVNDLRAADKAFHDNQCAEQAAGITHETPECLALNAAANEAASKVSRWRGGTR